MFQEQHARTCAELATIAELRGSPSSGLPTEPRSFRSELVRLTRGPAEAGRRSGSAASLVLCDRCHHIPCRLCFACKHLRVRYQRIFGKTACFSRINCHLASAKHSGQHGGTHDTSNRTENPCTTLPQSMLRQPLTSSQSWHLGSWGSRRVWPSHAESLHDTGSD